MAYFKCSGLNPTGNAAVGDVLSGKTFSNDSGIDKTGTMPNNGAVSATLNTSTTSYTVPAGYHNGSGTVSISTQSKSASSSTSAQTITPDSGKVLSSVSIAAVTPQRSAGTAATTTGIDNTGPYVYFPYGWWPNANANYGCFTRLTAAQAVACCPKQEKTVTSSRSAQTVTPDSGKLLSKVTVNALAPTGTYTASSRGASLDMGATSNYRYVNTNSVPNTNSGTYTFASGDTGGTKDMGAANTYRYVNAANVYAKGKADVSIGTGTHTGVRISQASSSSFDYDHYGYPYSTSFTVTNGGVYLIIFLCNSANGFPWSDPWQGVSNKPSTKITGGTVTAVGSLQSPSADVYIIKKVIATSTTITATLYNMGNTGMSCGIGIVPLTKS